MGVKALIYRPLDTFLKNIAQFLYLIVSFRFYLRIFASKLQHMQKIITTLVYSDLSLVKWILLGVLIIILIM
jgi:hypothetical protein